MISKNAQTNMPIQKCSLLLVLKTRASPHPHQPRSPNQTLVTKPSLNRRSVFYTLFLGKRIVLCPGLGRAKRWVKGGEGRRQDQTHESDVFLLASTEHQIFSPELHFCFRVVRYLAVFARGRGHSPQHPSTPAHRSWQLSDGLPRC